MAKETRQPHQESTKKTTSHSRQVSLPVYAEERGLTEQAVRWQCKEGKLPQGHSAKKIGRAWVITVPQ